MLNFLFKFDILEFLVIFSFGLLGEAAGELEGEPWGELEGELVREKEEEVIARELKRFRGFFLVPFSLGVLGDCGGDRDGDSCGGCSSCPFFSCFPFGSISS